MSIFALLPNEEIILLSNDLIHKKFDAGDSIIKQNDSGDSMFILMEGLLTVYINIPEKGETRVAIIGPGNFFGEMSLLTGEPRSATIKADTAVNVYEITHNTMKNLSE